MVDAVVGAVTDCPRRPDADRLQGEATTPQRLTSLPPTKDIMLQRIFLVGPEAGRSVPQGGSGWTQPEGGDGVRPAGAVGHATAAP
jgi:hypothetical protein